MRKTQYLLLAGLVTLCGCANADVTSMQKDAEKFVRTTSGSVQNLGTTINDTVELGKREYGKLKEGIEQATKTVDQVTDGAKKVQEGIDSLKDGQKWLEAKTTNDE